MSEITNGSGLREHVLLFSRFLRSPRTVGAVTASSAPGAGLTVPVSSTTGRTAPRTAASVVTGTLSAVAISSVPPPPQPAAPARTTSRATVVIRDIARSRGHKRRTVRRGGGVPFPP